MKAIHIKSRTLSRKLLAGALAGCFCAATPSLFAQSTNATLRGQATAGAEVSATNVDNGLTRRTMVTSDGSYSLAGLPPGTYRVSAGPGTERTVTLAVASTATLNFAGGEPAPSGGTQLEGVTVTANALAEVKTSEIGDTISLRQINTIPQVTRNFLEFADTRARHGLQPRSGQRHLFAAQRRAVGQRDQRLRRRRRPEGLRAEGRHQRTGQQPRQPVPAAGHLRVQGHHAELQGRVRPAQQRRGDRGDQVGHQRVPRRGVRQLHQRHLALEVPVEISPAASSRRRTRNTAWPSAARS